LDCKCSSWTVFGQNRCQNPYDNSRPQPVTTALRRRTAQGGTTIVLFHQKFRSDSQQK
jgi:hypothetical protein